MSHNTKNQRVPTSMSLHVSGRRIITAMLLLSTLCYSSCTNTSGSKATATATSGTYSLASQIFSLNVLSNIGTMFNDTNNVQQNTINAVDSVLADGNVIGLIGNWKCVWGPVVLTHKDNIVMGNPVASNTMFIANKEGTDTFVVAIAGTNAASLGSWTTKDLNVLTLVPWKPLDPLAGNISTGTYIGYSQLRDMMCNQQTAEAFLLSTVTKTTTSVIYVTGHSLGGALAPVYALHLRDSVFKDSNNVIINCMPVAGATPGDTLFSRYYSQKLGANTHRVWNNMDVVPHGFEPDMLALVPNIYNSLLVNDSIKIAPMPDTLAQILPLVIALGKTDGYYQLYPQALDSFTGTVFSTAFYDTVVGKGTHNVATFAGQAGCQHTQAYATHFGVDSFQTYIQRKFGTPVPFFSEGCAIPPDTSATSRRHH